ncbi:extensin-like [Penaeus chinensis]|uniref:extensin-like n=1 Tax=Penaeus chinensis TaxID=139456 RepID=UPI001FB5E2FB|nr:extensin-like [Penaeus chinensis]
MRDPCAYYTQLRLPSKGFLEDRDESEPGAFQKVPGRGFLKCRAALEGEGAREETNTSSVSKHQGFVGEAAFGRTPKPVESVATPTLSAKPSLYPPTPSASTVLPLQSPALNYSPIFDPPSSRQCYHFGSQSSNIHPLIVTVLPLRPIALYLFSTPLSRPCYHLEEKPLSTHIHICLSFYKKREQPTPKTTQRKREQPTPKTTQRKREQPTPKTTQRKREQPTPKTTQRKREQPTPKTTQRKREQPTPKTTQRKREQPTPKTTQRKREQPTPKTTQRKREQPTPKTTQRKREQPTPKTTQRKREQPTPKTTQRKREQPTPKTTQRKREQPTPKTTQRKREQPTPKPRVKIQYHIHVSSQTTGVKQFHHRLPASPYNEPTVKVINAIAQLAAQGRAGRTPCTAGSGDLTGRNHFEFSPFCTL